MTSHLPTAIRMRPEPGDGLLHPVPLAALATLLANDHILKGMGPAPLTGILSGFAGMVLFPMVLVAGWELVTAARGRWRGPADLPVVIACVVTVVGYASVELLPAATDAYRMGWGVMQWTASLPLMVTGVESVRAPVEVQATRDLWDLVAVPLILVSWRLGLARVARAKVRKQLDTKDGVHRRGSARGEA